MSGWGEGFCVNSVPALEGSGSRWGGSSGDEFRAQRGEVLDRGRRDQEVVETQHVSFSCGGMCAFDGELEPVFTCREMDGIAEGDGAGVDDASVIKVEFFAEQDPVERDVKNTVIGGFCESCGEAVIPV